MRSIGLIGSLAALLASAPLAAQGKGHDSNNKIPPGQLPPAGMCRIWIDGVPPGHQPSPTDCQTAVATKPANARVIWGDQASFPGKGKLKSQEARDRDGDTKTKDKVKDRSRGHDDADDDEDKVKDRDRRRDEDRDKVKDRDRRRDDDRKKAKGRHGRGDDDEDDEDDEDDDADRDADGRGAARSSRWPVISGVPSGMTTRAKSAKSKKGKNHGDE